LFDQEQDQDHEQESEFLAQKLVARCSH
jgi:hypothetical protein